MGRLTRARRLRVGVDVRALDLTNTDAFIEARIRLRPGQLVQLAPEPAGAGEDRCARVESWYVSSLGHDGPVYRGVCRWQDGDG